MISCDALRQILKLIYLGKSYWKSIEAERGRERRKEEKSVAVLLTQDAERVILVFCVTNTGIGLSKEKL